MNVMCNKTTVQKIFLISVFAWMVLGASLCMAAVIDTSIQYQTPQDKTFTLVVEQSYLHRKYVGIDKIAFMEKPMESNRGPDRELMSFFSAVALNDQDWWISLWDESARSSWDSDKTARRGLRQLFELYKRKIHGRDIALRDWVVVGNVVFIGVEFHGNKGAKSEKVLIPFILEKGRWKVSSEQMRSELHMAVYRKIYGKR